MIRFISKTCRWFGKQLAQAQRVNKDYPWLYGKNQDHASSAEVFLSTKVALSSELKSMRSMVFHITKCTEVYNWFMYLNLDS